MEFNINRLMRLMKRDAIVYRKPVLLAASAIFIIHILSFIMYVYDDGFVPELFLVIRFSFLLLVGGLLLTTIIFWEFKSTPGRIHFLSLPASISEKLVSRWIYTALLFPAFCLFLFSLSYLLSSLWFSYTNMPGGMRSLFGMIETLIGEGFLAYWIIHPIVFMFGIWYNRYVAPKVIVSALVAGFATVAVFFVMHRLFFYDMYTGFSLSEDVTVDVEPTFQFKIEGIMVPVAKTLGVVVVPLFFMVVSYFKLKEKQA